MTGRVKEAKARLMQLMSRHFASGLIGFIKTQYFFTLKRPASIRDKKASIVTWEQYEVAQVGNGRWNNEGVIEEAIHLNGKQTSSLVITTTFYSLLHSETLEEEHFKIKSRKYLENALVGG